MTIKIIFSYDGFCFNGSATQPSKGTVQDTFEEVLKNLGIKNRLILSGRTDKNVHATRQVASLALPKFWNDLGKLKDKLNYTLPNSIRIKYISKVDDDFHARFSAKKRVYRYIISSKELTAFNCKYLHYYPNINQNKILEAIKLFIGINDFEYFSKKGSEPKSTIREIYDIKFYQHKDIFIFKFVANSYLRSQIRMMVDFLLKISNDDLTIEDLKTQLKMKKQISWTLAPSNGLYLSRVVY